MRGALNLDVWYNSSKSPEMIRMCQCKARGLTACAVCLGLIFAPVGAKNPPASVVGQLLLAPAVNTASVSIASVAHFVQIADTVTGEVRLIPRPISEIVMQKLWPRDVEPG